MAATLAGPVPRLRLVARVAAVTCLALSLAALAGACGSDDEDAFPEVVYPRLTKVQKLPSGEQAGAGAGVPPARQATDGLAFPPPAALDSARRFASTRTGR